MKAKKIMLLTLGLCMLGGSMAGAQAFKTPEEKLPVVHWAVLRAAEGQLGTVQKLAAENVAPYAEQEEGTYVLYAAVDKNNPDISRVFELYRDDEAYTRHVNSKGFKRYAELRKPYLEDVRILEADGIALEQKNAGAGKVVYLRLLELKPESRDIYVELTQAENRRAVNQEPGVMGMFATSEKARPHVVHTMELFADEAAYSKYINSQSYRDYRQKLASMLVSEHVVENMPANIKLSAKGLKQE